MNPLHVDFYTDLKARLDAAPSGERGGIIEQAAVTMGVSVKTVYRRLEEVGWTSGRKIRADRGNLSVDEDLAKKLSGLVVTGTRENGKRIMGIKLARTILENNWEGVIDPETGEIVMPSDTMREILAVVWSEAKHRRNLLNLVVDDSNLRPISLQL